MDIQVTGHLLERWDPLCLVVHLCYNSSNHIYLGLFIFNPFHWLGGMDYPYLEH